MDRRENFSVSNARDFTAYYGFMLDFCGMDNVQVNVTTRQISPYGRIEGIIKRIFFEVVESNSNRYENLQNFAKKIEQLDEKIGLLKPKAIRVFIKSFDLWPSSPESEFLEKSGFTNEEKFRQLTDNHPYRIIYNNFMNIFAQNPKATFDNIRGQTNFNVSQMLLTNFFDKAGFIKSCEDSSVWSDLKERAITLRKGYAIDENLFADLFPEEIFPTATAPQKALKIERVTHHPVHLNEEHLRAISDTFLKALANSNDKLHQVFYELLDYTKFSHRENSSYDSLTLAVEEVFFIKVYTSSCYGLINGVLENETFNVLEFQKDNKIPDMKELIQCVPAIAQVITSALTKLPPMPEDKKLCARACYLKPEAFENEYQLGKIVSFKKFLSASTTDYGVGKAMTFCTATLNDAGIRYNFHATRIEIEHTSGKNIMHISTNRDEAEVLFIPGTRFQVTAVQKASVHEQSKIWMKEVA